MKKITFIINGKLGTKEKLKKEIIHHLENKFIIEFCYTLHRFHASHLAKISVEKGAEYLIAVGGDGTLNEVINGTMHCEEPLRAKVKIGLLPSGTGNDFARTIGMKKSLKQLIDLILNDQIKPIDVGQISYISLDGLLKSRYFNNIADIGIGGEVVAAVNRSKKRLGATLTFFVYSAISFLTYRHRHVRVQSQQVTWEGQVVSLSIANGKYFGSGLCIAPDAEVDDGFFSLVIVGNVSLFDFIRYMPCLRRGEHIVHKEVSYHKIETCQFDSLDKDCPIDLDGEFIGYPPIELKNFHHAIQFLRN